VDTTYIDDAAEAHVRAGDCLQPGAPSAGRVYFISQGEPWPLWDVVNGILAAAGVPPVSRSISPTMAFVLGWLCEGIYGTLRIKAEPPMTRFVARELATAHWFNIAAARRDLGFVPKVTMADGLSRLREWFQQTKVVASASASGNPVP
jgi:nucleoside-diphosphate-sugar epimerase